MAKTGIFFQRLQQNGEELKEIYSELYKNEAAYDSLVEMMERYSKSRSNQLKSLDKKREKDPDWYKGSGMLGVTMYPKLFAGGLKGLMGKLDYLSEQGI